MQNSKAVRGWYRPKFLDLFLCYRNEHSGTWDYFME